MGDVILEAGKHGTGPNVEGNVGTNRTGEVGVALGAFADGSDVTGVAVALVASHPEEGLELVAESKEETDTIGGSVIACFEASIGVKEAPLIFERHMGGDFFHLRVFDAEFFDFVASAVVGLVAEFDFASVVGQGAIKYFRIILSGRCNLGEPTINGVGEDGSGVFVFGVGFAAVD